MVQAEVAGMVEAGNSCGLLTRAQALKFLSEAQLKTRLATGAWARLFPSVYRVVGAPDGWRQRIEALMMWAGHGAALSHRSAAALHGFKEFDEGPLELTSTRALRVPKTVRLYRAKALPDNDVTEIDNLNVTNVTRTLIDLAASQSMLTMRPLFSQALREKKTTLKLLERAVRRSGNRPGVVDVRALLREFEGEGGPSESELEDFALRVIQEAGLPRPKVQWRTVVGRKLRRLDLIFEDSGVVIEADGYAFHSGLETFEDDRARRNSLTVRGLKVLHWTWEALQVRPEELIAELYVAMNLRREN